LKLPRRWTLTAPLFCTLAGGPLDPPYVRQGLRRGSAQDPETGSVHQRAFRSRQRRTVGLTTNLGVGSWGRIFDDPMVAIVDRVTFHAHIIETGTDSYRLRVTQASRSRRKTA
jgi:hypothetical protein